MCRDSCAAFAFAAIVTTALCCADVVSAQGSDQPRDVKRLGGSTALMVRPIQSVADLKTRLQDERMAGLVRSALAQAGLGRLSADVVRTIETATEAERVERCAEATIQNGMLVECDVHPGQTLQWMAFRRGREATIIHHARWAGRQPFRAYAFTVSDDGRLYTFVVPKDCGNVSLLSTAEAPAPAPTPTAAQPSPLPVTPERPASEQPAPEPTVSPSGSPESPTPVSPPTAESPFAPNPSSAPAPPLTEQPAPSTDGVRPTRIVIDGLFGKDRRTRPFDEDAVMGSSNAEFTQCSPLLGVKAGVGRRFDNNWEVAGLAGIAFSLVGEDEDSVREHQLFVDVEANRYFANDVFVGVGASLWDITRGDSFTPAALIHAGLPLSGGARRPVFFIVEGRLFFDQIDNVRNNYQVWGGVRLRF